MMALTAAATLPGAALIVGADEKNAYQELPSQEAGPSDAGIPLEEDQLAATLPLAKPGYQPPDLDIDVQTGFIILPHSNGLKPNELENELESGFTFLGEEPQPRVPREYSVGALVSAAQAALGLSERKARRLLRQTASGVGLQPSHVRGKPRSVAWSGKKLVVHATPKEHQQIAEAFETMRTHGFSRIDVEARWITGPASKIDNVNVHWTVSQWREWRRYSQNPLAGLPDPVAKNESPELAGGLGRARTVRVKNVPARFAILDQDEVAALFEQLQANDDTDPDAIEGLRQRVRRLLGYDDGPTARDPVDISHAGRVSLFNAQKVSIRDCSQRPFVVSVIPIVGPDGEAYQPVIHVVEEGLRLGLRSQLRADDSVRIDCELTLTHVADVDTFTFDGGVSRCFAENPEVTETVFTGVSVQLPEVETTGLDAAAVLPVGKTLLIGGLNTRDGDGNLQSMLVMLSPTKVTHALAETQKEQEQRLVIGGVAPRVIIQEEQEEFLGLVAP